MLISGAAMQEKKKSASNVQELYKIQIECIYDDLSEAQINQYEKRNREYNEFKSKFETVFGNRTDLNIEKGDVCTFVEYFSSSQVNHPTSLPGVPVTSSPLIQKQNGRVQHSTPPQSNQILLVNNQRLGLGLIVPNVAVQGASSAISPIGSTMSLVNVGGTNVTVTSSPIASSTMLTTNITPLISSRISAPVIAGPSPNANMMTKVVETIGGGKVLVQNRVQHKRHTDSTIVVSSGSSITSALLSSDKSNSSLGPTPAKKLKHCPPTQPTISIDLTEDLSKIDSLGGPSGKTYPSLVVTAKPCMRSDKEAKSPAIVKEKQALDTQVRRVLLFTSQNFTEWLIQTGLLRCDHYCSTHIGEDGFKIKLKLGQYTDSNKFPFSGGYVWVSDCCPQMYISVFSGSIFEGASYPPTTTMKLVYHWACHTSIQNILQWVNVSNLYIKNLFTNLRAVCTAAVHEHYERMGGRGKKIQVGVVSLGTTMKEYVSKRVRVDILCLLEPETKVVRVRAIEPTPDPERFVLRKFTKIFEIMELWVDKETTILVDNTVERSVLYNLGFRTVSQTMVKDKKGHDQYPNYEVMDYLRQIVPKMFQNTLSILSRQVIQQFLDELVWRERWGPFPSRAFDTIIKHLIEQTKINSGATLLNRLSKISSNPFKDWKYSKWRANCLSRPAGASVNRLPSVSTGGGSSNILGGASPQIPSPSTSLTQKTMSNVGGISQHIMSPSALPPLSDGSSAMESETSQVLLVSKNKNVEPILVEAAKILLEPYFYGTVKGDETLQNRKIEFSINCVICRKRLTNNIEFTDHLIRHAINKSNSTETKELCKLCCKVFPSLYFLQQHHVQSHTYPGTTNSSIWCLMCNTKYRDQTSLISHMTRYHGELELPYSCDVCQFRTSIFIKMIEHVNEYHKSDDLGFCPYCFQAFYFYRNGKPSVKNQYKFLYHVQRHQLPLAKKCYKCVVSSVNKTTLNEHEFEAHKSLTADEEVERYSTDNNTLMPAPLEDPIPPKGDKFKPTVGGPYKVVNFPSPLNIEDRDCQTVCIECDAKIGDNHFMSELLCMKCDFSTCCIRAMNEHHFSIHSYSMSVSRLYKSIPVISDTNLNCSCSFSTNDGNVMANHLVICNKTTCYGEPKHFTAPDIKSLIGRNSVEEDAASHELDLTYTVQPSTSDADINDATFVVQK